MHPTYVIEQQKGTVFHMKSLVKLSSEQVVSCRVCIYLEEDTVRGGLTYCNKRKKYIDPDKKCRKFTLNITAVSVRRQRSPKVRFFEDYSID